MESWLPAEPGWFGAQWWAHLIDDAEIIRWDAFPSGHVAVALVTLVIALRYQRKAGIAYLPFVAGLCVATMYLGYHFATDVVVGFVVATLTFLVFEPAIRWWESIWLPRPAATKPT
jgi:membrane-associated phospholipid phosphatase